MPPLLLVLYIIKIKSLVCNERCKKVHSSIMAKHAKTGGLWCWKLLWKQKCLQKCFQQKYTLATYIVGCVIQKRNLPQTYYVSLDPWSEKEYLTHEVAWAYYPLYFDAVLQLPVTVPHFDCGSLFELHKDLAEIVVVRRLQQRRRRQLRLPGKLPRLENHHHPAKNWVKNIYKGLFICFFKVYVYFAKTFKLV